jgi:hypothetical protein
MSLPVPPLELPNEKSEAFTLAEAYNMVTSTLQEPIHSNEMRAQMRKNMDEVDKCHILPEPKPKQDCTGARS